ncbi:hypothetical protein LY76DRAFT_287631 [Colletotrichum caudatum]|nr:hypothetical protein LY76DRAFT_287631 [Colletotrichum caudatum]
MTANNTIFLASLLPNKHLLHISRGGDTSRLGGLMPALFDMVCELNDDISFVTFLLLLLLHGCRLVAAWLLATRNMTMEMMKRHLMRRSDILCIYRRPGLYWGSGILAEKAPRRGDLNRTEKYERERTMRVNQRTRQSFLDEWI